MNARINYFDVLKAYAIILVVLYHFGNGVLPGGYLGVDIFFVINGFLLARSLDKIGGLADYATFVLRRLNRLLPALLVAVAFCLAWGAYWLVPHSFQDLAQAAFATVIFANNILSYLKTADYWAVVNDVKPLMHTWYLAIIVQFYLIIPVVLVMVRKVGMCVFGRTIAVKRIMAVFLLGSLILNFIPGFREAMLFYMLPFRLYEFCFGYLVAHLLRDLQEQVSPDGARGMVSMLLQRPFVARYGSIALYAGVSIFVLCGAPYLHTNVAVLLTVLLSGVFLLVLPYSQGISAQLVNDKYIAVIGKASFSIYIWHQIILAFYRSSWEYNISPLQMVFLSVMIVVAAAVSYRFIEVPMSRVAKNPRTDKHLFGGCCAVGLLLMAFSLDVHMRHGVIRDVPELEVYAADVNNIDHNAYNESAHRYNKAFRDADKIHWLVVGDSFGRDWINVLRESNIEDKVELSYIYSYLIRNEEAAKRAEMADVIFFALGTQPSPNYVRHFYHSLDQYRIDKSKVFVTGGKCFGYSVNQVYSKRHESDYPNPKMTVYIKDEAFEVNKRMASLCGERFIDLYAPITVEKNHVRVFSDDGYLLSQDSVHLTRAGARFYADRYRNLILKMVAESDKQKPDVQDNSVSSAGAN